MKILFAVWELNPFFQVGGLGDVARSLPKVLYSLGVDVRVILPYYKALKLHKQKRESVCKFTVDFDGKKETVKIFKIHFLNSSLPVYIVKNEKHLDVPLKPTDTFAFFNLAVVEILKNNYLSWEPEIIHCNDYHTALIPFLVKHNHLKYKTLLTIHNLNHQGKAHPDTVAKMGINPKICRVINWEIKKKQINFLLEGIVHADMINTVSPTYSREILAEEYGAGLDEILINEKQKISGILNGIDYDFRSPQINKNIVYHYSLNYKNVKDVPYKIYPPIEGKKLNKKALQEKLGFMVSDDLPLIGFIGRFDNKQKGLDIMHKMLLRLNMKNYQFIFLGRGNHEWEERFNWFSSFYPKNVYCQFVFDDYLASQIYAASDFLLIPSKYEPCGLIQMIAMQYGTVPIARATGGLKDSITDGVDGFLFKKYTSYDLEKKLKEAVRMKKNNKKRFDKIISAAMKKNFSWDKSAKEYLVLYQKLINIQT